MVLGHWDDKIRMASSLSLGSGQSTNGTHRVAAIRGCGPDIRALRPGYAGKASSRRRVRNQILQDEYMLTREPSRNGAEWVHRALFRLPDIWALQLASMEHFLGVTGWARWVGNSLPSTLSIQCCLWLIRLSREKARNTGPSSVPWVSPLGDW